MMVAENSHGFVEKLSLVKALYYDTKTLSKIKAMIKHEYSYIVPSYPSIEYVSLCEAL